MKEIFLKKICIYLVYIFITRNHLGVSLYSNCFTGLSQTDWIYEKQKQRDSNVNPLILIKET